MQIPMNSLQAANPLARTHWHPALAAVVAFVAGAVAAAFVVPATAFAQVSSGAEISLPAIAKDRGLHSGDFTLHPAMATQVHYDSNVFNGNESEQSKPRAATSLRLMPRLGLANDQISNLAFAFTSAGDVRLYLGSENKAIQQLTGVGGSAGLNVTLGGRKPLSLTVFDNFSRQLRANNWEILTGLNRNTNDVGARVEFHPGDIPERRPFNVALSGQYTKDMYDEFKAGDTDTIRSRLTGSWKFLPKTAALLDVGWDFRYYANTLLSSRALSYNSKPFRARVGLAGALTKRISVEATGGWGMSNHIGGDSFSSYLATASVGFRPSETTRMLVGYTHDFRDAYYGNFVDFHRGSITLRQRFGSILDISALFGVSYGMYGTYGADSLKIAKMAIELSTANRKDVALEGSVVANFDVARWFAMDLGYHLRAISTDYKIKALPANGGAVLDVGAYTAHEVYASAILRY